MDEYMYMTRELTYSIIFYSLYQAEGAAYQSMFVEHSSAKSTPESLLLTAKSDILNMRKYMKELADQLGIKA